MYYKLLLNPKNNRSMLHITILAIFLLPIASVQGEFTLSLIAFSIIMLFMFYHSKSTLQFYKDKYVFKTLLKEQTFHKDYYHIKLLGDSPRHSDGLDRSYLLTINNNDLHTKEIEIPMSMTGKQYEYIQKKLIELGEV